MKFKMFMENSSYSWHYMNPVLLNLNINSDLCYLIILYRIFYIVLKNYIKRFITRIHAEFINHREIFIKSQRSQFKSSFTMLSVWNPQYLLLSLICKCYSRSFRNARTINYGVCVCSHKHYLTAQYVRVARCICISSRETPRDVVALSSCFSLYISLLLPPTRGVHHHCVRPATWRSGIFFNGVLLQEGSLNFTETYGLFHLCGWHSRTSFGIFFQKNALL